MPKHILLDLIPFLRQGKPPDSRIGQQEADGEDGGRMHSGGDERLRTDESDAPHRYDGEGQQMDEEAVLCHKNGRKLRIILKLYIVTNIWTRRKRLPGRMHYLCQRRNNHKFLSI